MTQGMRYRRGQALVEFAMVIPIFLFIVIAIFDVGRAVFAFTSVTNGAREGARLAIVNQDSASVVARAISQAAIAETAAPNVTVSYRHLGPTSDYNANPVCSPLGLDCVAVVTFETTYNPIIPGIGRLLFPSGITVSAVSAERLEFICPNAKTASSACPRQP